MLSASFWGSFRCWPLWSIACQVCCSACRWWRCQSDFCGHPPRRSDRNPIRHGALDGVDWRHSRRGAGGCHPAGLDGVSRKRTQLSGLCSEPSQLPAGRIDSGPLATPHLHIHARLAEHLKKSLAGTLRRLSPPEAGHRVVRNHVDERLRGRRADARGSQRVLASRSLRQGARIQT